MSLISDPRIRHPWKSCRRRSTGCHIGLPDATSGLPFFFDPACGAGGGSEQIPVHPFEVACDGFFGGSLFDPFDRCCVSLYANRAPCSPCRRSMVDNPRSITWERCAVVNEVIPLPRVPLSSTTTNLPSCNKR